SSLCWSLRRTFRRRSLLPRRGLRRSRAPSSTTSSARSPRASRRSACAARADDQRALTRAFAPLGMRSAVATYARYPALADAMLPYTEFLLTKSTLPARDRELLWLRTAWLARSDYVWAQRVPAARRVGLNDAEIARVALGPDAPGWKPFDAALIRAADELRVDAFVNDPTWARPVWRAPRTSPPTPCSQ